MTRRFLAVCKRLRDLQQEFPEFNISLSPGLSDYGHRVLRRIRVGQEMKKKIFGKVDNG